MVVIVIVAIFASIAIPSYQSYSRRADDGFIEEVMRRFDELGLVIKEVESAAHQILIWYD